VTPDNNQWGGGESCEHGNEPWGSIKGGKFLNQLSDYQLFKLDSAPWS
jgi:hypothetical protein